MFFGKLSRAILLIIVALSLTGCATFYHPHYLSNNHLSWKQRQQQLQHLTDWYVTGSMSLKYNNQSDIVRVYWQQLANNYTISIISPFGIGSIRIVGTPTQVTLWKSATDKVSATTPELLMQQQLGWALPITYLKYWIRGLPVPKLHTRAKFDHYNHIVQLQQQNWQINYSNFQTIKGVDLPGKIDIKGPGINMRIVIHSWQDIH